MESFVGVRELREEFWVVVDMVLVGEEVFMGVEVGGFIYGPNDLNFFF